MTTCLVFIEVEESRIKKNSLEAITYAHRLSASGKVVALLPGSMSEEDIRQLEKYGASKVLQASYADHPHPPVEWYSAFIQQALQAEQADLLVLAHTVQGIAVAAPAAVYLKASFVGNVVDLPNTDQGFKVKRSIYSGKAFDWVEMKAHKKIIAIKQRSVELNPVADNQAERVDFQVTFSPSEKVKTTDQKKVTDEISLTDAEIIVSGGRGLKGPEHWTMIEDLAHVLHAATGCSKPVSDMGWRSHHEHVGQTGIKVAPKLYIAIGISGAIQHLAGVSSSKCIVVINKDPEAPFFKASDYGIVGDAFDIVPRLTEAFRKEKSKSDPH